MRITKAVGIGIAVASLTAFTASFSFNASAQSWKQASEKQPASAVELLAEAYGLQPVRAEELNVFGTYWYVMDGGILVPCPGLPTNPSSRIFSLGDGESFLCAEDAPRDSRLNYARMEADLNSVLGAIAQSQQERAEEAASRMLGTGQMSLMSGVQTLNEPSGLTAAEMYGTNLWMEISSVTNGVANLVLHNVAQGRVYELMGTPELPGGWSPEQALFTVTNQDWIDAAVPIGARTNALFFWARDWTDLDEDLDSLPDWWEFYYLGTLAFSGTDYDARGNTFLFDYQMQIDPNVIRFSIQATNGTFVTGGSVTLPLDVTNGVPFYCAVLVNDPDFDNAVWQPYTTSNIVAALNAGDGDYNIWIGLSGRSERSRVWQGITLTRDTTPPRIVVSAPATAVSTPMIQLRGYVSEALSSFTCDLTNSVGTVTNQPVLITAAHPDTNTWKFTTNYFQVYDVALAGGLNHITLRARDMAGHVTVTNIDYTLEISESTNPPGIRIVWPVEDQTIAGESMTLRGLLDDDTASASVRLGGTDYPAVVERGGRFFAANLPLSSGENVFVVNATNAAGVGTSQQLTVTKSPVSLTIDSFSAAQLGESFTSVTGTISNSSHDVWVGGVKGTVNPDNTWRADYVPVNDDAGAVTFDIALYPPGSDPTHTSPDAVRSEFVVMPPRVSVIGYMENYRSDVGLSSSWRRRNWEANVGGHSATFFSAQWGSSELNVDWPAQWPDGQTLWGWAIPDGPMAETPHLPWQYWQEAGATAWGPALRKVKTDVALTAGGPAISGERQLIRLTASAARYSVGLADYLTPILINPPEWFAWHHPGDIPVDVSSIQILGQNLTPTATNAYVGEMYVSLPAGATEQLPVTVSGASSYSFDIQAEPVTMRILANGIDLATNTPEFCVGQAVTNEIILTPTPPASVPVKYHWYFNPEYVNTVIPPVDANHSPTYTIDFGLNRTNTAKVWWINGDNKLVGCEVTVGAAAAVSTHSFVTIYRPSVTNFVNTSPSVTNAFMWLTATTPDTLSYGDLSVGIAGTNGMGWETAIDSKYDGRSGVTQIYKARYHVSPATYDKINTLASDAVDAEEWYHGFTRQYVTNQPGTHAVSLADFPSVSVPGSGAEIFVSSATDYIRFKPGRIDGDGNIYVTLGVVAWSAHGEYGRISGWITNNTPPATLTNSLIFPVWSEIVRSSGD